MKRLMFGAIKLTIVTYLSLILQYCGNCMNWLKAIRNLSKTLQNPWLFFYLSNWPKFKRNSYRNLIADHINIYYDMWYIISIIARLSFLFEKSSKHYIQKLSRKNCLIAALRWRILSYYREILTIIIYIIYNFYI